MNREYVYTKRGLRFVLEHLLENDVLGNPAYASNERAEEAFEKRAVLEFLIWYSDHALPEDFRFECEFDALEKDYPRDYAERILNGDGWLEKRPAPQRARKEPVLVEFPQPAS